MEPLLVDTDIAARTLALEIRDHARTRPVIVVGVDEEGGPLVSTNRLAGLVSPRIAIVPDPELVMKHLGENRWRQEFGAPSVSVYLPGSARAAVVAREEWTTESEERLRRMFSLGEDLRAAIFRAWSARCANSPTPLPPFRLTQRFIRDTRGLPANALDRLAGACLDALFDDSDRSSIRIKPLPTGITEIRRRRADGRILLCGVSRGSRSRTAGSQRVGPSH